MERTTAATYRDGSSRMADLETRCNQLESLLEIREEQIRSMERHFSQLPISSQAAKVPIFSQQFSCNIAIIIIIQMGVIV